MLIMSRVLEVRTPSEHGASNTGYVHIYIYIYIYVNGAYRISKGMYVYRCTYNSLGGSSSVPGAHHILSGLCER